MILVLAGAGKNLKSAAVLNIFNSVSNLQVFAIDQARFLLDELTLEDWILPSSDRGFLGAGFLPV